MLFIVFRFLKTLRATTKKKMSSSAIISSSTTAKAAAAIFEFAHPFLLFDKWFTEAKNAQGEAWPNAMSLATSTPDGFPSCRVVLMQKHEIGRIAFYTNYTSRKGEELAANPRAAVVFYWNKLQKQVRMEGVVSKGTKEESDLYFASRPRESRIASIASKQSKILEGGKEQLAAEVMAVRKSFEEKKEIENDEEEQVQLLDVTRPEHMGLYWITPSKIEFWHEGEFRVHNRSVYDLFEQEEGKKMWKQNMLYP
jgi:pyridoxamine 5'-phosphate oxidase